VGEYSHWGPLKLLVGRYSDQGLILLFDHPCPYVLITLRLISVWLPNKSTWLIHAPPPPKPPAPRKDGQASLGYRETTDVQMPD
jgi:hypothetical protein